MKKLTAALALLHLCSVSSAQNEFFRSDNNFSQEQLKVFYSSINLKDSLMLFNAVDYRLYAMNIHTKKLLWQRDMSWKSDVPPFFVDQGIWATGNGGSLRIDPKTGDKIADLPFERLETQPFSNAGIYYGTAIYDGGALYAYDVKADTVLWSRFLAHGCSVRPYFKPDRIIANAEGNNWLEINYNGKLTDPACENTEIRFPSELTCVRKYAVITHDGREFSDGVAQQMAEAYDYNPRAVYTEQHTLVLNATQLYVIGNKAKLKHTIELDDLITDDESYSKAEPAILKADKESVWLLYRNYLVQLDYLKKNIIKTTSLTKWNPHQAILKDDQLWLISRTDGKLYGLTL